MQAWCGGITAGILRYLFVLATGARELPPSLIGPAGRLFAKIAALASVAALALSIGTGEGGGSRDDDVSGSNDILDTTEGGSKVVQPAKLAQQGGTFSSFFTSPSPMLCVAGVFILYVSFSVDFYQLWVVLPRGKAAEAAAEAAAGRGGAAVANSHIGGNDAGNCATGLSGTKEDGADT